MGGLSGAPVPKGGPSYMFTALRRHLQNFRNSTLDDLGPALLQVVLQLRPELANLPRDLQREALRALSKRLLVAPPPPGLTTPPTTAIVYKRPPKEPARDPELKAAVIGLELFHDLPYAGGGGGGGGIDPTGRRRPATASPAGSGSWRGSSPAAVGAAPAPVQALPGRMLKRDIFTGACVCGCAVRACVRACVRAPTRERQHELERIAVRGELVVSLSVSV
jgi:hypothetical protein